MAFGSRLDYSLFYKQQETINITKVVKNRGTHRVMRFLKRINPANWFDEFSNIEITLEELEGRKK